MGGTHLSGAPSEFSAYLRYLFGPDCRSEVLGPHGPSGVGPLSESGALAGSDSLRAPGPSSLPVASAQAASGAGEPGLAVRFGRVPPLRGSGGSGSALAAGARSSARTRALAEHGPWALSARPSRPRDTGLDSTGSEPCGAGRFVSFHKTATLWFVRGSAAPEDALCTEWSWLRRCTPLLAGLLLLLLRLLALAADLERRCPRGCLGCVERIGARFPFAKASVYMRCAALHARRHARMGA